MVPSSEKSGGLWLIWSDEVNLTLIKKKGRHMIAAKVEGKGLQKEWIMVGVYGDPSRSDNPKIWKDIGEIVED